MIKTQVDALTKATEIAKGRLHEEPIEFAKAVISKSNERLGHGTNHLLVALLGATGSGKSSICNALAESDIAVSGVRRPTTSSTLACVWGPEDAGSLLHWLGVNTSHQVNAGPADLAGLVLLDVPDHDSVQVEHRLEMEQIAEHADLLVWVTDPEKYADEALHQYLRRLSYHSDAMIVVLNKADLLSPDDLTLCEQDLRRLLDNNGLVRTRLLVTSTAQDKGIPELRALLGQRLQGKEATTTRLQADLAVAASDLFAAAVGDRPKAKAAGVSKAAAARLSADLGDAMGAEAITDLVAKGYERDAKAATGWPVTRWAGKLRPHPLRKVHLDSGSSGRSSLPTMSAAQQTRVFATIRDAAEEATDGLPDPWPRKVRAASQPDKAELFDRLDHAVGDAVRATRPRRPMWWRFVGALQWLLLIAVVIGVLWLAALAGAAWLQLPDVPTPKLGVIPIPTLLLVGGALAGWLLGLMSRLLASNGARRSKKAATSAIGKSITNVSNDLILTPISIELSQRESLLTQLVAAGATHR